MHPDDLGGHLERVLDAAYGALDREQDAIRRRGAGSGGRAAAAQPAGRRRRPRRRARWRRGRAGGSPSRAWRALPLQAVDRVAGPGAAGVRARGGRDGAEEDRQPAQRQQQADRPDAAAVERRRPLAGLVARAPGERAAATRISIESAKWPMTKPGARWLRTVKPPSTICRRRRAAAARRAREVAAERAPAERQRAGCDRGDARRSPRACGCRTRSTRASRAAARTPP